MWDRLVLRKPDSKKQAEQLASARYKYTPKRFGEQVKLTSEEKMEEGEKQSDSSSEDG